MPAERPLRRDLALLLLVAAVFLVPSFWSRDLWPPDEPRYMEVAREMVVTGDYLIPHLNGEIYAEKPPVFFWLAAGLHHAGFGLDAGRVVAALAAFGTLVLVYLTALRMMPRGGAILSALVTVTALLFFMAKGGVLDPLLMFFAVAALGCGSRAFRPETRRRAAWWMGFYALAALGVLTKGPVGLFVPGLVLLAFGLVNRKRVRGGGWAHLAGALVFVAIVGAWLIPALLCGGPEYAREIGIDQTVGRLTKSRAHAEPVYHYLFTYPAVFFPWSRLFPLAFAAAVAQWKRGRDEHAQLLVLWFGVVFAFFSLISGKREGYLMPLLPAVGLALGRYVSGRAGDRFRWPRVFDWLARITFAVQGIGATALVLALYPAETLRRGGIGGSLVEAKSVLLEMHGPVLGVVVAAGLVGLAACGICFVGKRPRRLRAVWCLVVSGLFVSLAADLYVAPGINRLKSPRPFSEQAKPYLAQADKVYLLGGGMAGAYNLYTGRTVLPILQQKAETHRAVADRARVAVIARGHVRREVFGEPCRYPIPVRRQVGSTTMELIVNWDPETGRLVPPAPPASPSPR